MTKGLTAWRYYLKKFPNASAYDACALLNLIGTCGSLQGAYTSAAIEKWEKRHNVWEHTDESVAEWLQHVEDIAHPKMSMDNVLRQYFGVDRSTKKDEHFDPVELKDSFGYNRKVVAMFKKRLVNK